MALKSALWLFLLFFRYSSSQVAPPGVTLPLARTCGPSTANVVCMDRYASVMPYHFFRAPSHGDVDISFDQSHVPDPSFKLVGEADFLVFDQRRGLTILGSSPTYDLVFKISDAVHEAPVYVPDLNRLYLSQLAPPTG